MNIEEARRQEKEFLGSDSASRITLSEVAKRVNVSPSYLSQLYAKGRIPEAQKKKGRISVPDGRCILPPKNPDYSTKISSLYLTSGEVDEEQEEEDVKVEEEDAKIRAESSIRTVSMDDAEHHVAEDFNIGDISDALSKVASNDWVRGIIVLVRG